MRAAARITNMLVQEWIETFLKKNEDYNSDPMPGFPDGFENADVLGVQGQFAELWRKIWKLKKSMWDGQPLVAEQPREVLMDLIGHCFLAIDMLDREQLVQGMEVAIQRADPPTLKRSEVCGSVCAMGHTYNGSCKFRKGQ